MILSCSPARMLVREQYPSIHGQRYLVFGSTRVLVSIQSLVPGLAFSARMKSDEADAFVAAEESPAKSACGATPARAPAAKAPFSRSRRFVVCGLSVMDSILISTCKSN